MTGCISKKLGKGMGILLFFVFLFASFGMSEGATVQLNPRIGGDGGTEDYIYFGRYTHETASGPDAAGETPILWRVMDKPDGTSVTLLSNYLLARMPYQRDGLVSSLLTNLLGNTLSGVPLLGGAGGIFEIIVGKTGVVGLVDAILGETALNLLATSNVRLWLNGGADSLLDVNLGSDEAESLDGLLSYLHQAEKDAMGDPYGGDLNAFGLADLDVAGLLGGLNPLFTGLFATTLHGALPAGTGGAFNIPGGADYLDNLLFAGDGGALGGALGGVLDGVLGGLGDILDNILSGLGGLVGSLFGTDPFGGDGINTLGELTTAITDSTNPLNTLLGTLSATLSGIVNGVLGSTNVDAAAAIDALLGSLAIDGTFTPGLINNVAGHNALDSVISPGGLLGGLFDADFVSQDKFTLVNLDLLDGWFGAAANDYTGSEATLKDGTAASFWTATSGDVDDLSTPSAFGLLSAVKGITGTLSGTVGGVMDTLNVTDTSAGVRPMMVLDTTKVLFKAKLSDVAPANLAAIRGTVLDESIDPYVVFIDGNDNSDFGLQEFVKTSVTASKAEFFASAGVLKVTFGDTIKPAIGSAWPASADFLLTVDGGTPIPAETVTSADDTTLMLTFKGVPASPTTLALNYTMNDGAIAIGTDAVNVGSQDIIGTLTASITLAADVKTVEIANVSSDDVGRIKAQAYLREDGNLSGDVDVTFKLTGPGAPATVDPVPATDGDTTLVEIGAVTLSGDYTLTASAAGYDALATATKTFTVTLKGTTPPVQSGGTITEVKATGGDRTVEATATLKKTDGTAAPSGVAVTFTLLDGSTVIQSKPGTTNVSGIAAPAMFTNVDAGDYTVNASADLYGNKTSASTTVSDSSTQEPGPAGSITVSVQGGENVVAATVTAVKTGGGAGADVPVKFMLLNSSGTQVDTKTGTTNDSGKANVEFTNVKAGIGYKVKATTGTYGEATSSTATVKDPVQSPVEPGDNEGISFTMDEKNDGKITIGGTIADNNGNPLAGELVRFELSNAFNVYYTFTVKTDANGNLPLVVLIDDLFSGKYAVTDTRTGAPISIAQMKAALANGTYTLRMTVPGHTEIEEVTHTLVLRRSNAGIHAPIIPPMIDENGMLDTSGIVIRDADGKPVPEGTKVTFTMKDQKTGQVYTKVVLTGPDGKLLEDVDFSDIPNGNYTLTISAPGLPDMVYEDVAISGNSAGNGNLGGDGVCNTGAGLLLPILGAGLLAVRRKKQQ